MNDLYLPVVLNTDSYDLTKTLPESRILAVVMPLLVHVVIFVSDSVQVIRLPALRV